MSTEDEGSGSDSVEAAKAFVGTPEIAKCLRTLHPGYGYMEVSFGPRRATITRVEHRAQSPNLGDDSANAARVKGDAT